MSLPFLILFIFLSLFAIAALSFAPWVPTKNRDVKRAIELAGLKKSEVFYDLWCGDGRVVLEAAKTGAHCIGIELFFPLYLVCLVRNWIRKPFSSMSSPTWEIQKKWLIPPDSHLRENDKTVWQITFKCRDLFRENLTDANVIFLFGTPEPLARRLPEKLERELQPGARVISYVFPIPGWTPEQVCKGKDGNELSLYLYHR